MQAHYKVLIGAAIVVAASAGAAVAAPAGPESPSNCTFSNGTTTCASVGAPQTTSSVSAPDANGCTTTTTTTTVTTTYAAHRGTYNSNGVALSAPASTTATTDSSTSQSCSSAPDAAKTCQDAGYNYNAGGTWTLPSFRGAPPVTYGQFFTCGVGNNLTLAQSQELSNAFYPACRAAKGVVHVWNDDPAYNTDPWNAANYPASGWYMGCYNDPSLYA